jgi:hypothetical protein
LFGDFEKRNFPGSFILSIRAAGTSGEAVYAVSGLPELPGKLYNAVSGLPELPGKLYTQYPGCRNFSGSCILSIRAAGFSREAV